MTDKPNSGDDQTVTVAELMARYGVEPPAKGRAHRRRARAGGVSVAELTGEIPALTPETLAAHAEAEAEAADAEAADAADAAAQHAPETDTDAEVAESADTGVADTDPVEAEPGDDVVAADTEDAVADEPAPAESPDSGPADEVDSAATAVFDAAADHGPADRDEDASTDAATATAALPVSETPTDRVDDDTAAHDPWRRPSGPVTVIPPIAQDFDDRWPDEPAADTAEAEQAAFAEPVEGPAEAPVSHDEESAAEQATRPSFGSALRQWFGLAAQTVLGVVVGAAVFLGFIRLWDVLPYVALVLAVLVILAMAAVVRILRKTDDSVSILLAVVVGVIVTIGPLVFVLSSP